MKRLAILIACLVLLIIVAITRESRFEIVTESKDVTLQAKDPSISLLFVGDSMFGRNVEVLMSRSGSEYPFEYVKDLLASADEVVTNLEGPILYNHTHTPSQSVRFSFASTTAALLAAHNIEYVSLANNHTYDFGVSGFNETRAILRAAKVVPVGNPYTFDDSYVVRAAHNGIPVIFVAFNSTNPHFDTTKAIDFIKNLKRDLTDYVVVLIHGGEEYKLHSNTYQERLYRSLIDAGADAIIGHHPHVTEEIELYHGKPIFYSLGNFIFDQYFSQDVQQGLAVRLTLSKAQAAYELIPLKSIHSQPQQMDTTESAAFLTNLAARSNNDSYTSVERGIFTIAR